MPRRDIKTYSTYSEGLFHQENEPEEGEIVDDFELIVSSDEELSMRKRIRELEAENEEIEQIAVISRSYVAELKPLINNLEINRSARVPTDVSSISSTEFVTPKKRKRRKSKERKRKHCQHHQHQHHYHYHKKHEQHQHKDQKLSQYNTVKAHSGTRKSQCKRRQKMNEKKYPKVHINRNVYKEIDYETVSLESPISTNSSYSLSDNDMSYKNSLICNRKEEIFNNGAYITRDTLRLAVARNSTDSRFPRKKSCLKDKLLRQELVSHTPKSMESGEAVNEDEDGADDDVEVIEPEVDIHTVEEDSMEETELRLIALKSAVLKKHIARKRRNAEVAYSPTDFEDMLSVRIVNGADNKIDVIDVIDIEDDDTQNGCVIVSPEASPQLMMLDDQEESQQMIDCKPIDMDIANSDSEDATLDTWSKRLTPTFPTISYASHEFANKFHYNIYSQETELPPPPPGVDDYEVPTPPPPCLQAHIEKMHDMEIERDELIDKCMTETKTNIHKEFIESERIKTVKFSPDIDREDDKEVDEEEIALRALLLSKFQSPKNLKKLKQPINIEPYEKLNKPTENKTEPKKPTESILKEAVKRLKIHSKSDNLKEQPKVDTFMNILQTSDSFLNSSFNPHALIKDNIGNKTPLGTLKKRLIKLKHQSQYKERDELTVEEENNLQMPIEISQKVLKVKPEIESKRQYVDKHNENNFSKESQIFCSSKCFESDVTVVANTVDVSDITRRLQKIKDEIINAAESQNPIVGANAKEKQMDLEVKTMTQNLSNNIETISNTISEIKEEVDSNTQVLRNSALNTIIPLPNIVDNVDDPNFANKSNKNIVNSDFDVIKNISTFKVTIINSPILIENNDITSAIKESSLGDNNNINLNSNKINVTSTELSKTIENFQVSKNAKTSTEIENENSTPNLSPVSVATKASASISPTYSLLRTTKIVKPNKVINTNLKRRVNETLFTPLKPSKSEQSAKEISRLISSFDQVKHMCIVPKLVISVQNSSNESSEDECDNYDSLYKPLYDYNDNASPLSLNLESPCRTPLRSNSPTDAINNLKDTEFEEKLDKLLEFARTNNVHNKFNGDKTNQKDFVKQCSITNKTPLAVRHLPNAAQSEYRRLVHRMKLLENQRKSSKVNESGDKSTVDSKEPISSAEDSKKLENDNATSSNGSGSKASLVKQVLIRNANNNSTTSELQTNSFIENDLSKIKKNSVLRSYENLYVKIGAGIVNHLDKSLRLVEEAKRTKIKKLKLENRLQELKAEMEIIQTKHKEEQEKMSLIYPNICSSNEVITSLKQKRSKVFKAALSLGKTIKGEEYRINNDLKQIILTKTKELAIEIKAVNSLKVHDICKINSIKGLTTYDKKEGLEQANIKEVIEENLKLHHQKSVEMKDVSCSKLKSNLNSQQYKDTKNDIYVTTTNATLSTTQFGGNTENLDHDSQMNIKQHMDSQQRTPPKLESVSDFMGQREENPLCSYESPLAYLRNMNSNMDPNGIICPYDLMGNCEDSTCKFMHISPKNKT